MDMVKFVISFGIKSQGERHREDKLVAHTFSHNSVGKSVQGSQAYSPGKNKQKTSTIILLYYYTKTSSIILLYERSS